LIGIKFWLELRRKLIKNHQLWIEKEQYNFRLKTSKSRALKILIKLSITGKSLGKISLGAHKVGKLIWLN
jgi:hypothetical protein